MITVVGNLKGGAGKSTIAFNLAVWLATNNETITAFDLDPQQTLTDVTEVRSEEGDAPGFNLYHGGVNRLDDIRSIQGEVIVDVGTADMEAVKGALAIADRVLIPVPPSQADVWSTQRFLTLIQQNAKDKSPQVCVFINRADTHRSVRESDDAEEALTELEGVTLLSQRICQRTAFRRSFTEGLAVFEMVPWSKAAKEFIGFASALYPNITLQENKRANS